MPACWSTSFSWPRRGRRRRRRYRHRLKADIMFDLEVFTSAAMLIQFGRFRAFSIRLKRAAANHYDTQV